MDPSNPSSSTPSDIVWDGPGATQAAPTAPAARAPAAKDIIWDTPHNQTGQPEEWHTLKAFGRGLVRSYLSATSGASEEEMQHRERQLHVAPKGQPTTGDKVSEFAGGMLAPIPGGVGKSTSFAGARAADAAAGTTLGQQTGSAGVQALERTIARLPGGGMLAESLRSQNEKLGETTEDIIGRLSGGADTSAAGAGGVLKGQLEIAAKRMKGEAAGHFDEVEKFLPKGHQVGVKSTIDILKELTTPVPGAEATSAMLIDKDIAAVAQGLEKDLAKSTSQSMPYDVLKQLRTQVGGKIDWGPFSTDPRNGALKRLYGALTADMANGAAAVGPEAAAAVKTANAAYAASKESQKVLTSVMNKAGGPEKVFTSLMNGTKEGATTIRQVVGAVDMPTRQILAASALQRMGRATPGVQDAAGGMFSANTFLTNWNRMSPEAREVLFGNLPGDFSQSISQLSANVEALKAYAKILPNTSNTAQVAMWGGEVGGAMMALMTGHFGTAAGIAGSAAGTKMLAAALTNPQTAKWLAQQTGQIVSRSAYATAALEGAEHRRIGKRAIEDVDYQYPGTIQ